MKKKLPIFAAIVVIAFIAAWNLGLKEYYEFRQAANSKYIDDLYNYAALTPRPKYYEDAMNEIDDRVFNQYSSYSSTGEVYEFIMHQIDTGYLQKFPAGRHRKEAMDILARGYYHKAVKENDASIAVEALKKYPGSLSQKALVEFVVGKFDKADKMLKAKTSAGILQPAYAFLQLFAQMKKENRCELPLVLVVTNEVMEWNDLNPSTQNAIASNLPYVEDLHKKLQEYGRPNWQVNMLLDPEGMQKRTNLLVDMNERPPASSHFWINDTACMETADSLAYYISYWISNALGENVIKVVAHDPKELASLSKSGVIVVHYKLTNSEDGGTPTIYYSKWESFGGFFQGYSMGIKTDFTSKIILPRKKDFSYDGFVYNGSADASESITSRHGIKNPYMPLLGDLSKSVALKIVGKLGLIVE